MYYCVDKTTGKRTSLNTINEDEARQILWNAFDDSYRPEMRGLERSLCLARIDDAWKKHLLTMDHLRSGIGLVGYAQVDPKTEYKREGMKAFDEMWVGVQDKITDAVFRMEEEEEFDQVVGVAVTGNPGVYRQDRCGHARGSTQIGLA